MPFVDLELIGGPEKRPIVIAEYNEAWPETFEEHRARVAQVLGALAIRIDHVGSTSVPGLAAKPIVDIQVAVADPDDEAAFVAPMELAGYLLRVREPGHRMMRTPERDVHIHFWRAGSEDEVRHIAFRDRLRTNRDDRIAYENLKRELALREWDDMNDYAYAKGGLISEILGRALGSADPS